MTIAFSAIAAVLFIAAVLTFVRTHTRIARAEIRRGRIASISEIAPGVPTPSAVMMAGWSGYQRYIIAALAAVIAMLLRASRL